VTTLRVALLPMKPRLRDILTESLGRNAMQILDAPFDQQGMLEALQPDAVICETGNPLDVAMADRLLRLVPRSRVVMVAATGDQAVVYELQPQRRVILNVSPVDLIEAIRFGTAGRKLH
jgi:hypothetical protein